MRIPKFSTYFSEQQKKKKRVPKKLGEYQIDLCLTNALENNQANAIRSPLASSSCPYKLQVVNGIRPKRETGDSTSPSI